MYLNSCITGQQKVALNDRRTVWGLPDLEKPSVHVTDLTVGTSTTSSRGVCNWSMT